jgi:hypothetical protein
MVDNLSKFGHNFQIKSIVCLITRQNFIEQIFDILEEKYYDNDSLKWIVGQCKEYFHEYHAKITFDVFKAKINNIGHDILKTSVVESLKDVYKHLEANDLDFVQDKTLDFFRNQKLKNAIIESVDILDRDGDIEGIKRIIDEAMSAGSERDFGHEYFEMIEERYSEMARETISTPWDTINDLTQGGLAKGELGVVVAPAGAGKTWVLAKIGSEALKKQKCIIHFTLELNEAYVGLRYDSIFTGIANQNLKYHKEEVEKKLQKFETGKLLIKYFPTKSASIHTFSAYLKRLIAIGEKIDLVVIDYADLMQDASKAKEVRHQLGNIYDDLRGLAGEFEVPVWTASQTNRSALEDDIIEAQKISESYQKVMTADFVMSLSRKIEDKTQNTGRFHVIKNRFGPDGLTYPARVNTNTGQIELYESDSLGGKEQQKKIDNRDRVSRKMLATKYKDLIQ